MRLSVVIPAYNEAERITETVNSLSVYLGLHFRAAHEIIIVDDGSVDGTEKLVKELALRLSPLKVIRNNTNHGKGFAVRQGALEACGDFIFFTDADLSTPPEEIGRFVKIFQVDAADILIGSRHMKESDIKVKQPPHRRVMGKIFNWFVKRLTPLRFYDTQCGFKGFRKETALKLFLISKEGGFVFDVEILLLARKMGASVREIPIAWRDSSKSKVQPISDGVRMFLDLITISKFSKTYGKAQN